MRILVTGGAGFIGSAVIRNWIANTNHTILNVDKLTYAGSLLNLPINSKRLKFYKFDISNKLKMKQVISRYKPIFFFNVAAETHVDRSIEYPMNFVNTNIVGVVNILECLRKNLSNKNFKKKFINFIHISTDEVYGSTTVSKPFTEKSSYNPSSPYSASKAASDHLVISWAKTYNLPFIVTNCSNNFGPRQFPEKLIPLMIHKLFNEEDLPLYGDGNQKRDWIFVENHVEGLILASKYGTRGNTYLFGSGVAVSNKIVVKNLIKIYKKHYKKCNSKIVYVEDRPAHDRTYLIDPNRSIKLLKWSCKNNLFTELEKTFLWYKNNQNWTKNISKKSKYTYIRQGLIK